MGRKKKKGRKGRHPDPKHAPQGQAPDGPVPDPLLHGWPDARLDLHGRSRPEAEAATRNFVLTQARLGRGRLVHVLTGKGTGELFRHVGRLLRGELVGWTEDVAEDLQGAGYRVRLR